MCGIFGIIGQSDSIKKITHLVKNAEIRGKDSSGAVIVRDSNCVIYKAEATATKLFRSIPYQKARLILGHSRLITNDFSENQPVHRDNVITLHNGIVVNHDALWAKHNLIRNTQLDSEIIPALFAKFFKKSGNGGPQLRKY